MFKGMTTKQLDRIGSEPLIKLPEFEEIPTRALWQDQTVVITYVRRFNCLVCQQGARELSKISPLLRQHNIRPVLIGLGKVGIDDFLQGNYFDGEVFIDAKRECLEAHGFKHFNLLQLWWTTGWNGVQEYRRRMYLQASTSRPVRKADHDGFQCGGTLIVERGGLKILMSQKQGRLGDYVSNVKILKSLNIPIPKHWQKPPAVFLGRRRLSTIPDENLALIGTSASDQDILNPNHQIKSQEEQEQEEFQEINFSPPNSPTGSTSSGRESPWLVSSPVGFYSEDNIPLKAQQWEEDQRIFEGKNQSGNIKGLHNIFGFPDDEKEEHIGLLGRSQSDYRLSSSAPAV